MTLIPFILSRGSSTMELQFVPDMANLELLSLL